MPVQVNCSCGRTLRLADNLRGKHVKCPDCASALAVPGREIVEEAQPAGARPEKQLQQQTKPSSAPRRSAQVRQSAKSGKRRAQSSRSDDDQNADWLDESIDPWDQTALPPRTKTRSANTSSGAKGRPRRKFPLVPILIVGGIGVVLVGVVAIAVMIAFVRGQTGNAPVTSSPPDIANATLAAGIFPPRPTFQPRFVSGVQLANTRLTGAGPGEATQMNLYLPGGDHADRSLGCVLVAPAGTNLLVGNSLDGGDYHDETLPYAEAGFMTIQYSLDGPVADMEAASDAQFAAAYTKFKAAGAGTLNTRSVIEFVKARFPEVNPDRIYTAGHSSAGTVSLLAAEYLPDVAACIAYAPCSDTEAFHAEISGTWGIDRLLPGLREFDRQFSPIANVQKLNCPLFVFQARDDSVVDVAETKRFADQARSHNQQVTYVEVASGEHYDSMISQGIPQAVEWLQKIDSQSK